jgi:hypothetical protein
VDGDWVALNKGLVGFGSDNSRGVLDNLAVQAVPADATFDSTEYFEDGAADQFTGPKTGTWSISGGRYVATGWSMSSLDLGATVEPSSSLEIEGTLSTTAIGGLVFDAYATNDYKFVALDVAGQRVVVGHVDKKGSWIVDATFAKALTAGLDYTLDLVLAATVVTVTLGGNVLGSYAYNSAVGDGELGTLSKSGTVSVDRVRVKSNDASFAGTVQPAELRVGDAVVAEGAGGTTKIVTIGLTLSKALAADTTIGWRTVNGTATGGSDFIGVSAGTLTLAAGSTSASIAVTVNGDWAYEGNETFSVEITNGAGLNLADPAGLVTINNDDVAASIQTTASTTEGNSGTKTITLTVTLSGPASATVTVNYATANGTAIAGSDYVAKTGTLTFAAGVTSQSFTITINGDTAKEANETFAVNLTGVTNGSVGNGTATVTIVNDDGSPLLAAAPAGGAGATAEVTAAQLDAVVQQAKLEWLKVDPTADLSGVTVLVGDLEGLMLGVTGIGTVTIDPTAAGWGWSISGGAMDLRTVVLHELGHALGRHHDEDGLMAATLAAGVSHEVQDSVQTISSGTSLRAQAIANGVPLAASAIRAVTTRWLRPAWPSNLRQQVLRPQRAAATFHLRRHR